MPKRCYAVIALPSRRPPHLSHCGRPSLNPTAGSGRDKDRLAMIPRCRQLSLDAARAGDATPTNTRAGEAAHPSHVDPSMEKHPVRSGGSRSPPDGVGPQSAEGSPQRVRRRDRPGDVSRAWTVTSRDRTGVSCPPPPFAPQSDARRLCGSSEGRPAASRGGGHGPATGLKLWPSRRCPLPPRRQTIRAMAGARAREGGGGGMDSVLSVVK